MYDDTIPFFITSNNNQSTTYWQAVGSISIGMDTYEALPQKNLNLILDTYRNKDLPADTAEVKQKYFKPVPVYDGRCVTNGIICYSNYTYMHIPIHFMYNRYGHKNLNDWDGNSIKIDE